MTREIDMSKTTAIPNSLGRLRILPAGAAKARTQDNSGGEDREINLRPYNAG
jgi:hypothetical protein